MSRPRWTRREAIGALSAAAASAPLLAQSGCYWGPRIQWERASEWLSAIDALDAGLEPGRVPAGIAGPAAELLGQVTLIPRRLVETEPLDPAVSLFGRTIPHPILVGPDPEYTGTGKEPGVVAGARAAGAIVVIGETGEVSRKALGSAGPDPWLLAGSGGSSTRTADRASALGASAVVVALPPGDPSPGIRRLGALGLTLPVLASGVGDPGSARECLAAGASGLIVTDVRAFEEVVAAGGVAIPVLLAGGFYRGAEILKALALGATAVLVDRPVAWGRARAGSPGVRRVIELLQRELEYDMGMAGVFRRAAVTRSLVRAYFA
jgi:4-hydroxymandelate oxidase